jgi:ABC-type transporter Mla maintaining outer membrane lipid asymmetry ATPase subunit MlaF
MLLADDLALDAPDGRPLFAGLHLSLERGANLLVLGPGGCGKSQLLRALAGTLPPRSGRVRLGGVDLWPGEGALALAGRVRLGFAFAQGGLLSNQTLRDNVRLPLRFAGVPAGEAATRAERALARFGLEAAAGLRPHAVSAGVRKLASYARVAALEPDLVFLDDPLEGVESGDRAAVLDLIQGWAADPARTLVLALEDPGPFAGLPARRLHLAPVGPTPSTPEQP